MNAPFDDLEQEGRIEPVPTGQADVARLNAVVDRDLATAEDLRGRNRDWALAIAYNAMFQACIALIVKKSQAEFALMIGVSAATLQNWEQGRRSPVGPARALLKVAAENPRAVERALSA